MKTTHVAKNISTILNKNTLYLAQKYAQMFVPGDYLKDFPKLHSLKTVRFSEQIMFVDKLSQMAPNGGYCSFIIN